MTRNMRCKLCINRDATQLVEGLEVGGKADRGNSSAALSYRCSKSIFGQAKLSAELGITINT